MFSLQKPRHIPTLPKGGAEVQQASAVSPLTLRSLRDRGHPAFTLSANSVQQKKA
jgi:hypothetical protein